MGLGVLLLMPATDAAPRSDTGGDTVDKGFLYRHEVVSEMPWSIHILRLDRRRRDLVLTTSLGNGHRIGKATVSDQVRLLPDSIGRPVAAINGDLYLDGGGLSGDPRDLLIREGELVSAPAGHACFWIDSRGRPHQTNVHSRLRVILPGRRGLVVGLNEVGFDDGAVLYTRSESVV